MIRAQCHCDNVKLEINDLPGSVTRCNCSICNRLGVLWGYYSPLEVKLSFSQDAPVAYCWGDEFLLFHHCPVCGCTTHYTVTEKYMQKYEEDRIAVNFRLVDPEILADIPVKEFDGKNLI